MTSVIGLWVAKASSRWREMGGQKNQRDDNQVTANASAKPANAIVGQ